ncbi:hypothetical protein FEK30_01115 (plasmid) [Picosynechococcus sp. PCC 11901]|uniref:phage terminase large subunit family protein n=1 Tax=Picosynechococcus sp. PCC 11901 TaxID=2579791 RepID=UPI0010FBE511|nr:terminase family protein [Picosynechococcus sp. PCC 11901]QCS48144.1 hypothetical protein FEK30_01115 [Picosynechococcus sp. PCC 11901]
MYQIKLTPKNKIKILGKNSKDAYNFKPLPDTWLEFAKLCFIRSGASVIRFDPYDYQIKLVEQIEAGKTTVITKTRQLGITETISNYFLFKACKNAGYLAVIFSKSQADTSNIAKRVRRQLEGLSDYVKPKTDSLTDIEILNGGRILFRNSTPNGARGLESVSDLLYDEAAFVDEIEEIYKSSIPCTTVVDNPKIIILSTPNGQSGFYFDKLNQNNGDKDLLKICENIKNKLIAPVQFWRDENGWNKFIIHWLAHPKFSHREDYLRDIQESTGLSETIVQQEYNLSFTDSEQLVFNAGLVRTNARLEDYETEYDSNSLYFIGIDTANLGDDYTVATVLKLNQGHYSLVYQYRKRRASSEYDIYQISELIDKFNPEEIGIEVTGGTGQVYLEQLTRAYSNYKFKAIKTTQESKLGMIERLILAMDKAVISYPKKCPIIEEMLCFRRIGKKLESQQGKHDDCVMSLAFALNVTPFSINERKTINIKDIRTI